MEGLWFQRVWPQAPHTCSESDGSDILVAYCNDGSNGQYAIDVLSEPAFLLEAIGFGRCSARTWWKHVDGAVKYDVSERPAFFYLGRSRHKFGEAGIEIAFFIC